MRMPLRLLILLLAISSSLQGDEPKKADLRRHPAKLKLVSSKRLDDGRRELEFDFQIEKDVVVWADQYPKSPAEEPWPKIVLKSSQGAPLAAEILYPERKRYDIDFAIDSNIESYYYSGNTKLLVRYVPPDAQDPLRIRCVFRAWNQKSSCCLGQKSIEMDIPRQK